MKYNPETHHRHSQRLVGYDYALAGAYYVTVCTQEYEPLFGEIAPMEASSSEPAQMTDSITPHMELNTKGKIVQFTWGDLVHHIVGIELDAFIVMPHHIHGIIIINGAETTRRTDAKECVATSPTLYTPKEVTLSEIVRQFKTFSARRINAFRRTPGATVWQRNYYDHIIRNDDDLLRISSYIADNPARWAQCPEDWWAGSQYS